MASTRNKNSREDYILEQRSLNLAREYDLFKNASNGHAYTTSLPEFGFNPSTMGRDNFSYNSIDIETALFGINSTNLVDPQPPVVPFLKTVPEIKFFNRLPKLIMPMPLVIENNQRPTF
jgi:hypothetical protein